MEVVVVGSGRMGSQLAWEYALGGHSVTVLAREELRARSALEDVLAAIRAFEVATEEDSAAAARRLEVSPLQPNSPPETSRLIVESIAEDLEIKGEVLAPLVAALPDATIATNTSSLSIDAIGGAIGAPGRTLGAHYWNPPLLMRLVELNIGPRTEPGRVDEMERVLKDLGKEPVRIEKDVPGFAWNRLQFALLREALWLVEQGVATPETVDLIVRDGLARRWTQTGPFETAALGGGATFAAVADNLFPELSNATAAGSLELQLPASDDPALAELRERRDRFLAEALRLDRHPPDV